MQISKPLLEHIRQKGGIMHLICKVCGSGEQNGFWTSDPLAFTIACHKCERPIFNQIVTLTPEPSHEVFPKIPDHVLQAARTVDVWFQEQGIPKWELMGIRSR